MASRAAHRRATLLRLSEAAITLCEEEGFEFTVEDVATHAKVSARTVHRYVESKEDLFFVHFHLGMELFEHRCNELKGQPLLQRFHGATQVVSDLLDEERELIQRALLQWQNHPELMRSYAVMFHKWVEIFTQEALQPPLSPTLLYARVFASSYMGIIDASMGQWMTHTQPITHLIDLVKEASNLLPTPKT